MKTDFDFERAVALMDIMHKVSTIAPKATSIMGLAQAELDELNAEAQGIARENAERIKKEEQEKAAEEVRRQKAKAAEEAAAQRAEKEEADARARVTISSKTATIADNNARRL